MHAVTWYPVPDRPIACPLWFFLSEPRVRILDWCARERQCESGHEFMASVCSKRCDSVSWCSRGALSHQTGRFPSSVDVLVVLSFNESGNQLLTFTIARCTLLANSERDF